FRSKCTRNKRGRTIVRSEYDSAVENLRVRLCTYEGKEKLRLRLMLVEHPFGTMKRAFNQGYVLLKGLRKVKGEVGFTSARVKNISLSANSNRNMGEKLVLGNKSPINDMFTRIGRLILLELLLPWLFLLQLSSSCLLELRLLVLHLRLLGLLLERLPSLLVRL